MIGKATPKTVTNPQTALLDLPIFSNDDGQREAEADDLLLVVGAEGSDASDGQLVDRGHPLVAIADILACWVIALLLRDFDATIDSEGKARVTNDEGAKDRADVRESYSFKSNRRAYLAPNRIQQPLDALRNPIDISRRPEPTDDDDNLY